MVPVESIFYRDFFSGVKEESLLADCVILGQARNDGGGEK
jgi:hypothetical protein